MKSFVTTAALVGLAAALPNKAARADGLTTTTYVLPATPTDGLTTITYVLPATPTDSTTTTITFADPAWPPLSSTTIGLPATPSQDACAAKCYDEWVKCKTAPNANNSYCAAHISECLGYNWIPMPDKLPTTCAPSKPSSTTIGLPATPSQDACAAKCYDEWVKCKTAPNANNSYCAAHISECLGYNWIPSTDKPATCAPSKPTGTGAPGGTGVTTGPGKPTGTLPPVSNGAAAMAPFGVAALAALALL